MNKKPLLTPRERNLTLFLIIFVASVCCVSFLFMPALRGQEDAAAALVAARSTESETRVEVDRVAVVSESVAELTRQIEERLPRLRAFTQTEDLEAEFTDFLLGNEILPHTVMLAFAEDGGQPDETVKLSISIAGTAKPSALLLLNEYVNGIYSFRLTQMSTSEGNLANDDEPVSCEFTVEAVLRIGE